MMNFLLLSILIFICSLLLARRFGAMFVVMLALVGALFFAFISQNIFFVILGELRWIWIAVFLAGVVANIAKLDGFEMGDEVPSEKQDE